MEYIGLYWKSMQRNGLYMHAVEVDGMECNGAH